MSSAGAPFWSVQLLKVTLYMCTKIMSKVVAPFLWAYVTREFFHSPCISPVFLVIHSQTKFPLSLKGSITHCCPDYFSVISGLFLLITGTSIIKASTEMLSCLVVNCSYVSLPCSDSCNSVHVETLWFFSDIPLESEKVIGVILKTWTLLMQVVSKK